MSICLMPDGGVHIKQQHTPCDPAESQVAIASLADGDGDHHHFDRQGCLDIAINDGAASSQQKKSSPPAPAITTPLGEPIAIAQTEPTLSLGTQPDISPQLLPLRSIVVLRI